MATKRTFAERLKREITASPKKAAVLGLVCVVAIWFWTPLVLKWAGKKSPAEEPAVVNAEEDAGATPVVAAPATETNKTAVSAPTSDWQKILKWIRSDPKMKPHLAVGRRDPFAPAVSHQIAKAREEAPPASAPEITPQQAGISVSSTVVGPRNRTALINGRAYREQQQITGSKTTERFLIVEIRPKSVVLERNGQQYELKIPRTENVQFGD